MSRLKIWWIILLTIFLGCIPPPPDTPTPPYLIGIARFDPIIFIKVDDEFDANQKYLIQKAFTDWERASNYKLSFQITWDEPKPGPYEQHQKPYKDSGLFLWHLPKNEDTLSTKMLEDWESYWGLMVYGPGENSGNVILFDHIPDEKFYSVALHEIGHLLGLKHIKGTPVVMHPNALGNCLSEEDVNYLCELYGCTPVSQCPVEWYADGKAEVTTSSFLLSEPSSAHQSRFLAPVW